VVHDALLPSFLHSELLASHLPVSFVPSAGDTRVEGEAIIQGDSWMGEVIDDLLSSFAEGAV
jgi:hypothetical protein